MNTFEKDKTYVAGTYARFPIEIVSGKGSIAVGSDGKTYLDMGSGIAVNAFGFSDEIWANAVKEQIDRFQHTSNLYYASPCASLAEALCVKTGYKKVFFGNSGAEANECAIKIARKWGEEKGKSEIVTLVSSFHGRTITTLAATGQEVFHKHFGPFPEGFSYTPANDIPALRAAVSDKTAAIMLEFVQGEGGVNVLDGAFVEEIFRLAKEKDFLVIADEVQTGNGRTGKYFASENFGVKPDITTTAKGLGGGLPIGACLIGEKAETVLGFGDHGSTFGGNPVVCAGALSVVSRIDENLLASVREKGEYIKKKLEGKPGVTSVSGMGLMLGVKTALDSRAVVNACLKKGVLFLTAKDKVRLLPALNVPYEVIDQAIDVLLSVVKESV